MLKENACIAGDAKKRQKLFFEGNVDKFVPFKHDESVYEHAISGKTLCDKKMLLSIATYSMSFGLRICACLRLMKMYPECKELAEKLLKLAHKHKIKETNVLTA